VDSLADLDRVVGEIELRMVPGPGRFLDAVGRPGDSLFLEAHVTGRVPVARGEDGDALRPGGFQPLVQDGDDPVSLVHREGTPGAEIQLDVDHQDRVSRSMPCGGSVHGAPHLPSESL
jgi:hypothetical protein